MLGEVWVYTPTTQVQVLNSNLGAYFIINEGNMHLAPPWLDLVSFSLAPCKVEDGQNLFSALHNLYQGLPIMLPIWWKHDSGCYCKLFLQYKSQNEILLSFCPVSHIIAYIEADNILYRNTLV